MKIIFDIGANKGQNLNYFLQKADLVIAIEADTNLVNHIKSMFDSFVQSKKLIIENIAVVNQENAEFIDFYISKINHTYSTLCPENLNNYYKQKIKCEKVSTLINKYLQIYNMPEIEYIKIDVERYDKFILQDLLQNNIIPNNLSVECFDSDVIELILNSPYNSFKFIEGGKKIKDIEIYNINNKKKIINFDYNSSGPYGDDILGNYYDKKSILPYFLINGLGWKDIHCSIKKHKNLSKIVYDPIIHSQGFRYHLKRIYPSLIKSLKNRLYNRYFKQ